jgi:SPP1 family predicted phage head-tail adaptor
MRAGRMRARVQFQTELRVEDGSGGAAAGTWSDLVGCRGELIPESGREAIAAGHLEGANYARLRVRYQQALAGLTTQSRCLIDGVAHQIRSVIDPDQKATHA